MTKENLGNENRGGYGSTGKQNKGEMSNPWDLAASIVLPAARDFQDTLKESIPILLGQMKETKPQAPSAPTKQKEEKEEQSQEQSTKKVYILQGERVGETFAFDNEINALIHYARLTLKKGDEEPESYGGWNLEELEML